ncbi:electron transfer flavoprotein subunit beta/FixA family protein [Georgenia halophila]|uniref:Electron transfer flavoprotein subunit beta/FixA family protein n=1 Tax=Georgenia halophila TaxID=620889 RepID=A0ABP8L138_9MICO
MRIVVCVKYVPDLQAERSLDADGHLVRGLDDGINELDENAVEAALGLAEAAGEDTAAEVVALAVGPDDAVDAVRRALQMGAASGVHVLDDRVAGADVMGTARVLAAAVRTIEQDGPVDVVVTGMATMDGLSSMVPAALAAELDRPALTLASRVSLEGRTLTMTRSIGEADEEQAAELPVVLSVTDQLNEPRLPGAKSLMSARKKPVATWSLDDLAGGAELAGDAEPGGDGALAATTVVTAEPLPPREAGRIITDTGDAGTKLATYLVENKLV